MFKAMACLSSYKATACSFHSDTGATSSYTSNGIDDVGMSGRTALLCVLPHTNIMLLPPTRADLKASCLTCPMPCSHTENKSAAPTNKVSSGTSSIAARMSSMLSTSGMMTPISEAVGKRSVINDEKAGNSGSREKSVSSIGTPST